MDIAKAVREHEDLCQTSLGRVSYLQEEERKLKEAEEFEDEAWFRERSSPWTCRNPSSAADAGNQRIHQERRKTPAQ